MHFRYDINALRAIAVMSVVIFHFYPQILTGGFAGVDVFFVISGFLMTGIIMRGFEKENFNLIQFYIARCNRIIPALAVLCFVLIILGWFILLPTEYKDLGKHVASSITFISNMIYWRESGYFDTSSLTKWLLHTWSLSVEWQFYMLYPIYLMILKKIFNIKLLPIVIYTTFILSLTIGIYLTSKAPSFAYFSLFGRAWELLLGGCVYFIAQNKTYKNNLFYLGITLIIASSFFIDSSMQWPGYLALIPTLGAALVLLSNNQNSYLVQNSLVQKLGLYSYSIYLWHWPIVVFLHYFNLTEYSILGIIFSIFLGYLSYTYVESQKFKKLSSYKNIFLSPVLYVIGFISLLGISIYTTHGFINRFSESIKIATLESQNKNTYDCMSQDECIIGNPNNIKIIVVGDSHANTLLSGIYSLLNHPNDGLKAYVKSGCPFLLNTTILNRPNCRNDNNLRFNQILSTSNTPIVLDGRWAAHLLYGENDPARIQGDNQPVTYFETSENLTVEEKMAFFKKRLIETICPIAKNAPVYLVLPTPEIPQNVPLAVTQRLIKKDSAPIYIPLNDYLSRSKEIRDTIVDVAEICKANILDPIPYLCPDDQCIAEYNNRPLYTDGDHLSEYGIQFLKPMLEKIRYKQ